jgi:nucleotide-binding universal stress UspA family protein
LRREGYRPSQIESRTTSGFVRFLTPAQNKISYEIKTGNAADQVVNACEDARYDLVVMTTSHLDSWLSSLFSDARKIISKINTPVLLVQ